MADVNAVIADLVAETEELDAIVAPLDDAGWSTPTPAEGWTIAHQVGHLAWTDEASLLAVLEPEEFERQKATIGLDSVDTGAEEWASLPPAELLSKWRAGRAQLAAALAAVPHGTKIGWYGPPMSAASMATARIMETWAHGRDVADALGVVRTPTARMRHVAHIGVRARNFAYFVNGRQPPAAEFRVELRAPDGSQWAWGPDDAAQRVSGPAEDFCLLVTQRAHRNDLAVEATGADANEWLTIAQAFAGPPGKGRDPK